MPRKITTELFIGEAKKKHGDKYDYSKTIYVDNGTKVTIICPTHGEFHIRAGGHLDKREGWGGCPTCGKAQRIKNTTKTTPDFIKEAKAKFGEKFDYSKVNYINATTKVTIICPAHGEFQQTPIEHTRKIRGERGNHGCPECGKIVRDKNHTMTTQEFIEKAIEKHGDKYDYSKTIYVYSNTKVTIICPTHGEFEIIANFHVRKRGLVGCQKCGKIVRYKKQTMTTQEFTEKAIEKHGDKYDYSKVKYINCKTKVTIICPTHGDFQQRPSIHCAGAGCSCCINKTEGILYEFLKKNNSNLEMKKIIQQYNASWYKENYRYDFYIELENGKKIIIECDGEQHYIHNNYFHRDDWSFEKQQGRDIYKMNKALENGVSMIRIHQEEVYKNTIDWKNEITDAINDIKNENEDSIKLLGCLKDKIYWELE
jgi:very-short-patch-repair endonuclease/endogenous inhibitor of DNA gyrase (YacG/DUF329 family)